MISWPFRRKGGQPRGRPLPPRQTSYAAGSPVPHASATVVPGPAAATAAKAGRSEVPARGARYVLVVLVSLGIIHVVFMLGVEALRYFRSEIDIARLEREVGGLEGEAFQLRSIIEHGDDPSYREQLARRQGYMYPDETRIVTDEILSNPSLIPPADPLR